MSEHNHSSGANESHETGHRSVAHSHDPGHQHGHSHGAIDPLIISSERGIWAIKWSFLVLFATAILQLAVALISGSVALLADTVHNFGDAATAIPLWIAFAFGRRKPSKRFTYGYGRTEDLAGATIVLIILLSAIVAGYESINRILHPKSVEHLWAVIAASLIGLLGNEAVAVFRIKVGKQMGSAALVADGYHARADGFASLSVLVGAIGVWLGYPLADPLVGLLITIVILRIVWESGKSVFTRLLDGVDPEVTDEIKHAASHAKGVKAVTNVRVRWLGHRLHVELSIGVNAGLSVEQGHDIATEVRHQLLHHLSYLSNAIIHVDPATASGEEYHALLDHTHDGLPTHSNY